jgi:hypothetical protein
MPPELSYSILQRLPREVRQVLNGYLKDVSGVLGATLQAAILYGSAARGEYLPERSNLNLLLVLATVDVELMRRYGKRHRPWGKERVVVPLMVTLTELKQAARLFPLEYAEIHDHHLLLLGEDPLVGFTVDSAALWGQCRQELAGNVVRLRQRLMEGAGSPEAISILMTLSLTTLLPCLRSLLRVRGLGVPPATEPLLERINDDLSLDVTVFKEVWELKRAVITPGPAELPRLLERYLGALELLRIKTDAIDISA